MKKLILLLAIILVIIVSIVYTKKIFYNPKNLKAYTNQEAKTILENNEFENGDIIFQTSLSSQSKAIQLATDSKYSHCGIIFNENGLYVYEAVQPVKMTPLNEWISKGKEGKYVIKRLKNSKILKTDSYKKFCDELNKFSGKDYDASFGWSDSKIYCSELVWKGYMRGLGIELCKPTKLKDFDLTNALVKKKLEERYGKNIPKNESVVSPMAIFESNLLKTVKSN